MKIVSSKGEVNEFHIDLQAVLDMEAQDPNFSVVNLADRLSENVRMTDLVTIAKVVGWDYLDFIGAGYTVQDLMEVLTGCFEELGFTSAQEETPTSI